MAQQQKHIAFLAVTAQVRAIENRYRNEHIQRESRAVVRAQYAEMVKQREQAQRTSGFSFLR